MPTPRTSALDRPARAAGRRLVLLFDGTWNRREHTTNVWRTRLLVEPSERQLVYYDQGVGTDRATRFRGGASAAAPTRRAA